MHNTRTRTIASLIAIAAATVAAVGLTGGAASATVQLSRHQTVQLGVHQQTVQLSRHQTVQLGVHQQTVQLGQRTVQLTVQL